MRSSTFFQLLHIYPKDYSVVRICRKKQQQTNACNFASTKEHTPTGRGLSWAAAEDTCPPPCPRPQEGYLPLARRRADPGPEVEPRAHGASPVAALGPEREGRRAVRQGDIPELRDIVPDALHGRLEGGFQLLLRSGRGVHLVSRDGCSSA